MCLNQAASLKDPLLQLRAEGYEDRLQRCIPTYHVCSGSLSPVHSLPIRQNTPEEVMLCIFPGSLFWLLMPVTLWLVLLYPLSFPFPEAPAGVEPSFPTCWRLDRLLRCLGLCLWPPKTSGTSSHPPCWCHLLSPGWKSISTWI